MILVGISLPRLTRSHESRLSPMMPSRVRSLVRSPVDSSSRVLTIKIAIFSPPLSKMEIPFRRLLSSMIEIIERPRPPILVETPLPLPIIRSVRSPKSSIQKVSPHTSPTTFVEKSSQKPDETRRSLEPMISSATSRV